MISKLSTSKPACQLLSSLMSRYRKVLVDKHNEWKESLCRKILFVKKYFYTHSRLNISHTVRKKQGGVLSEE